MAEIGNPTFANEALSQRQDSRAPVAHVHCLRHPIDAARIETRASAVLGNPASLPWLGLGFSGLILNAVSLILLFVGARIASILATIGSIGSAFLFLADQAGVAVSIRPPPTITAVEIVATVLIVAIVCFASRVYRETGLELGRAT